MEQLIKLKSRKGERERERKREIKKSTILQNLSNTCLNRVKLCSLLKVMIAQPFGNSSSETNHTMRKIHTGTLCSDLLTSSFFRII